MTFRLVYWLVLALAGAHTLWRGGAPERWGIAIYAIASATTPLVLAPMAERYAAPEWGALLVDIANYGAFLVLAVAARRFWPLWVSAMQGVATAANLLGFLHETKLNLTYALLEQAWAFPIVAVIMMGGERHQLRRARNGSDPSWKSFSSLSIPTQLRTGPNAF